MPNNDDGGWFSVKKRGRDDEQIENDKKRAMEARTAKNKRKKPAPAKKTKQMTIKSSFAAAARKKNQTKKKKRSTSYLDDDEDSIDDFVVDDDEEEMDDDADDEDEFVEESSDEDDEDLHLDDDDSDEDDADRPTKRRNQQRKKPAARSTKQSNSKNRMVLETDEEEDADDGDDSDLGGLSSSDEEGTFLPTDMKQRTTKPTKALQRASLAAKNRRNPALSLEGTKKQALNLKERFASRGRKAAAIRTPATLALKKKSVIDVDDENLTSPSPESAKKPPMKKKMQASPHSSSESEQGKSSSRSSKYFRGATMKWNAFEAIESGFERKDNDNDDDDTAQADASPIAKKSSKNSTSKPTAEGNKNPLADDHSEDEEEVEYVDIFDDNNVDDDDNDEVAKINTNKTPKRPPGTSKYFTEESTGLEDTPNPATRMANKLLPNFQLSDSDSDDDVQVVHRPKKILKKKLSKKSSSTIDEGHVITTSNEEDDSMDEDMRLAIKVSKKEHEKTQQRNRNDEIVIDDSDSMDEDEKVALRKALKASKKEARIKQQSIDNMNSEDEKPADELLEESSDEGDEDDDRGDSYEEEQKEASSLLHTAEKLSAEVIKHMTGWTKEKDSSASAHKGMIVDGALSLGSLAGSESNLEGTSHEWISQEEMQKACPNVTLSNYQLIGVNWLALLHGMKTTIEGKRNTNVNGVLADEMGLGKTVQTIAFLAWLKYKRKISATIDVDSDDGASVVEEASWPHIIAVPVSVLPNWEREFETFCPDMNVVKYHGSMLEREELKNTLREYLPQTRSKNPPLDVILAPVTYFQKEKSDDRKFLNKFRFDYLVVDEAHMLKNSDSLRYRMLDKVSTRHRLLLTGTPVQNSPKELLNMLCFLMPLFSRGGGPMDDDANAGERMLQHFVDEKTVEQGGNEERAYKKLKQLFAPFVLRRKKDDVISQLLPPKKKVVEFVKLDKEGRTVYNNIIADHVNKNGKKLSAAIGDHLFTNLRKAAHHPLLLRTRHSSPSEVEHMATHFHKYGAFKGEGSTKARVKEELSKFNDFHIHLTALDLIEENKHRRGDLQRYILAEEALFSSAKFVRLQSLLPKLISEGHRILIFSVWTSCLDLLGCLVEHLDLEYLRMDGSTSSEDRQALIDRFNRDDSIPIFLLSTKACGLGINLTAADCCIIHDLDFNPFNDLQAEDRCHRIGQKKPVTIYKLVTEETVDSQIYEMQERKSKMNAAIMESSSSSDKKERKEMLQSAVNQFLGNPKGNRNPASNKENSENEVVCIL